MLGLAFKPNTDDLREAPALEIIHLLKSEGARVKAYDPVRRSRPRGLLPGVELCSDAYAVAEGADALLLITPWSEFRRLDLDRIRQSMRTRCWSTAATCTTRPKWSPAASSIRPSAARPWSRSPKSRLPAAQPDAEPEPLLTAL